MLIYCSLKMANKINDRRYSINNRWNKYPKQSLYPTIRQPYTFISWHHIRHVIEMADENFLIYCCPLKF